MLNRRKLAMWAAAGLMVAGTVLGVLPGLSQVASAATATPTPVVTDKTAPTGDKTGSAEKKSGSDTYLAQALGITSEQLSAAQETARLAAIQQALDKGLITQAQADALKNKTGIGGRGGLGAFVKSSDIDEDALLAKALGITVEKLDAARLKAEELRLAQAVADGKITQEQADLMKAEQALKTYMAEKNVYANAVAQAVKDGVITQAQADAILAKSNGKGSFGFGMGGHGGGRGGGR